jgi:hypothetical protein
MVWPRSVTEFSWWGFQSTSTRVTVAFDSVSLKEKVIQHISHRTIASTGKAWATKIRLAQTSFDDARYFLQSMWGRDEHNGFVHQMRQRYTLWLPALWDILRY